MTIGREIVALVVEDSADLIAALMVEATRYGVRLLSAMTLADGLVILAKEAAVEVLLLDLNLPDSHGVESLKRMATATRGKVPIVVMSNDDAALNEAEILGTGAVDIVNKSGGLGRTISQIVRLNVERHRALQTIKRQLAEREELCSAQAGEIADLRAKLDALAAVPVVANSTEGSGALRGVWDVFTRLEDRIFRLAGQHHAP